MSSKYSNKNKPQPPHSEHGRHSKGTLTGGQPQTSTSRCACHFATRSRQTLQNHAGAESSKNSSQDKHTKRQTDDCGGTVTPSEVGSKKTGITQETDTGLSDTYSSTSQQNNEEYTQSQKKPVEEKTNENRSSHNQRELNEKSTKIQRKAGKDKSKKADSKQNGEEKETEGRRRKKGSLDEDSLQMFLSTDNMEEEEYQRRRERGGVRQMVYPVHYTEEMKRKHEEIIRQILEDFNLEETKNKYKNLNAYEHRWNGKSLADYRFRSELIRMMGSEVVRLNDQSWSQKFQERLKEDYERQLDEQEHNLARAEKQRLHRLRIEGILQKDNRESGTLSSDLDLLWDSHPPHIRKTNSSLSPRFSRTHPRPRISSEELKSCSQESNHIFSNDELHERERNLSARRHDRMYHPSDEVKSQMAHLKKREEEEKERGEKEENEREQKQDASSRHVTFDDEDSLRLRAEPYSWQDDEEGVAKRRMKKHRRLPQHVAKLYEEESVTGLYDLAEQLLTSSGHASVTSKENSKAVKVAAL